MGEQTTKRTLADNARMRARTFRLCAPFSSLQLLVVVVCAAATTDTEFIMTRPCAHFFSTGQRRKIMPDSAAPHGTSTPATAGFYVSHEMGQKAGTASWAAHSTQLSLP